MNNQRLYRGIPIGGKDFVYGCYVEIGDLNRRTFILEGKCWHYEKAEIDFTIEKPAILGGIIEVIPSTVGQQVGLQDKNKKEAYAGDKVSAYGYSNWVIDWHNAGWKLKQDTIDHWTDIPKEFIVFGHIHTEEKP